jgi:hypothetical protein
VGVTAPTIAGFSLLSMLWIALTIKEQWLFEVQIKYSLMMVVSTVAERVRVVRKVLVTSSGVDKTAVGVTAPTIAGSAWLSMLWVLQHQQ